MPSTAASVAALSSIVQNAVDGLAPEKLHELFVDRSNSLVLPCGRVQSFVVKNSSWQSAEPRFKRTVCSNFINKDALLYCEDNQCFY